MRSSNKRAFTGKTDLSSLIGFSRYGIRDLRAIIGLQVFTGCTHDGDNNHRGLRDLATI